MSTVDALQETLVAEHAAVAVLAELGARVSVSESPGAAALIRTAYEAHRGRRDRLTGEVSRRGATPRTPEPAYSVDSEDRSASHLLRIALRTEQRCAEAYAAMVAGTAGPDRRWAVSALTDSARRALTLGGQASAFPGLAELD
jgi:hypothetical protein